MRIEIISGSARNKTVTNRVALHLEGLLIQQTEHEVNVLDARDYDLPPVQNVWSSIDKTPDEFKSLAKRIFNADAFILVSPEYNGSYSPALKNLLDHFPKQHRKVFGIVTASPGAMGGIRAAMQLQHLVFALFGIGSPYMLIVPAVDKKFDTEGNIIDESIQKSIDSFVSEFIWLAEKVVEENVEA